MIKQIKKEVNQISDLLVDTRRHLHMYPELSFEEVETSAYIQAMLKEHGIPFQTGYAQHGIVAEIRGGRKGPLVYLRGDMDALPISEKNNVAYKSKNKGIMHACGHDVHTTCVLGAAVILNRLKADLKGKVRVIFQPGEEKHPGGASIMIKEGAIKSAAKAQIFGQHVYPPLDVGKVGFHPGEYMASADEIYIEVIGKGGHAALPQKLIDPILISAQVISNLHTLVARYADPKIPTVLSIGKVTSMGGATNVIPDRVTLMGTFRTMDEDNRRHMHRVIETMVKQTCKSYGAKAKLNIRYGYPTLVNDVAMTEKAMKDASAYLGPKQVVLLDKRMTSEDFSYYSQIMPACFYRLGTGNDKRGLTSPVHTPTFDIDEAALSIGAGLMAYLATQAI